MASRLPRGLLSKLWRYGATSVVTVTINQVVLLLVAIGWRDTPSVIAAAIATTVATGPSYILHRRWVWNRQGRSHVVKEILPFTGLSLAGLVVSTATVMLAVAWSRPLVHDRLVHALVLDGSYLGGFAVLWAVRFVILELLVFGQRRDTGAAVEPHLDYDHR